MAGGDTLKGAMASIVAGVSAIALLAIEPRRVPAVRGRDIGRVMFALSGERLAIGAVEVGPRGVTIDDRVELGSRFAELELGETFVPALSLVPFRLQMSHGSEILAYFGLLEGLTWLMAARDDGYELGLTPEMSWLMRRSWATYDLRRMHETWPRPPSEARD